MSQPIPESMRAIRLEEENGALVNSELQTTYHKRLQFTAVQEGLEYYQKNMTAGKILLVTQEVPFQI